jgi:hypothetical protein
MSNPVGQSRAKWPGPPQQRHVSRACLARWALMSMGMPGGRARWRPWGFGRGRHGCRLQGDISREGAHGKASHSCGCCGVAPDSGGVKSFVCEAVLVELLCSSIPLVRHVIWQVVSAGFRDLVLEDWIKTASECQDNREVIQVP